MTEIEIWKDVVGYEGFYMVSNLGRVKSLPNSRRKIERIMKQVKYNKFHFGLTLCKNGVRKIKNTHTMVLEAFVGPRPSEDMEACHGDSNPENNRVENLRWDTKKGNAKDRSDAMAQHGEKNGVSILKNSDVVEIKRRLKNGERGAHLAKEFGVTKGAIYNIKDGYTWSWLQI